MKDQLLNKVALCKYTRCHVFLLFLIKVDIVIIPPLKRRITPQ